MEEKYKKIQKIIIPKSWSSAKHWSSNLFFNVGSPSGLPLFDHLRSVFLFHYNMVFYGLATFKPGRKHFSWMLYKNTQISFNKEKLENPCGIWGRFFLCYSLFACFGFLICCDHFNRASSNGLEVMLTLKLSRVQIPNNLVKKVCTFGCQSCFGLITFCLFLPKNSHFWTKSA